MSLANTAADDASAAPSGRPARQSYGFLFRYGVIFSMAFVLTFFLQVAVAKMLFTPWYLPIGGTIAALVVVVGAAGERRWWRVAIALVCVALACLEWFFVLVATVLPGYSGPIEQGSAIPAFHAMLAEGGEFDESSFQNHPMTALVFFQGRWCPFCMTQLQELESHHADFSRVGADVVVVSIEDTQKAAQTQKDFPHLTVVSDERRELSGAIDLINRNSAPDGTDSAAPTILLVDRTGTVQWLHRPTRFIARPSASELVKMIEDLKR